MKKKGEPTEKSIKTIQSKRERVREGQSNQEVKTTSKWSNIFLLGVLKVRVRQKKYLKR